MKRRVICAPMPLPLQLCRAFKTVVFVIDQLEAFMKAAKQTLLYNVLDALQHSQVQVGAVLLKMTVQPFRGTTCHSPHCWYVLCCARQHTALHPGFHKERRPCTSAATCSSCNSTSPHSMHHATLQAHVDTA